MKQETTTDRGYGYRLNFDRGLEAEPRIGEDQDSRDGHWDGLCERVRRQAANGDYDRIVGKKAAREFAAGTGPARTADGVPADGQWHRNPVTGEIQRAVLA